MCSSGNTGSLEQEDKSNCRESSKCVKKRSEKVRFASHRDGRINNPVFKVERGAGGGFFYKQRKLLLNPPYIQTYLKESSFIANIIMQVNY